MSIGGLRRAERFVDGLAKNQALIMLDEYAETARHPELADAPLLLWGYSLGGCYALDAPDARSDRLIGFVRQKAA